MTLDELRAHLEARRRTLEAQQQQYVAQANAAAGAVELCRELLALCDAPPAPGEAPAG